MSVFDEFSEDDLINITFEVCDAQEKGTVPASIFIKYLEDVTGHSHDNGKLLLLYNMLDPKRLNVPVAQETFHATMKKWIAICNQDCISEPEAYKVKAETTRNQQYKDSRLFISDEDAEIFEGRTEGYQMMLDINSSIEDLKYLNQKMSEQLMGMKKSMASEEIYLQLTDDIVELRDRLMSMQKPLGNFKYIWKELEDTKSKMAHLHEENDLICKCITSLNKSIESLTTKLNFLEENFFQEIEEIKSQKENIFQVLMEEIILANLRPFIKTWKKVLQRLEIFLESSQHLTKLSCLNIEHHEAEQVDETEHMEQSSLEEEMKTFSNYMEGTTCSKSAFLLPICFPFLTSGAIFSLDNDDFNFPTLLIDALNLEHISTQKRCWMFPNQFFVGQRWGFKENLLNSKRHASKTEYGQNDTSRIFKANTQISHENGVNRIHLPRYLGVTQWSWDHNTPQYLSSEINLKQTFPSVLGLFNLHCIPTCPSPPIMPTLPEDVRQPTETQHANLPSLVKDSSADAATCNTPSVILPEYAVRPVTDRETNVALRSVSPHLRHSNRNARKSASSLTSVDNEGHVIDLLKDQLPDIQISDEDKKKNIELLEEAKKVSERFLTRRGRKSRSSLSESPTALSPSLSPSVSPASSRSNSLTLPNPTDSDVCTSIVESVPPLQNPTKGISNRKENDQRKAAQGRVVPHTAGLESPKEKLSEQKENFDPHKHMDDLSQFCTSDSNTGKISLSSSKNFCENELGKELPKKNKGNDSPFKGHLHGPGIIALGTKLKGSAPLLNDSRVSCKTELHTSSNRSPLLRAMSWDHAEPCNIEKAPFRPSEDTKNCATSNQSGDIPTKLPPFKDLQIQVQPVRMQKLTKLREEHILMRNQNLVGLKLPDLSEAAEQERGSSPIPFSMEEEESKNRCDVMPNIPDTLLRKLHVHTPLSGSSPPLTEREVENVFVQLSLAFRNDSYTLESRINQAERERNLAEENTEKELDNFKGAVTSSVSLWHHSEHRDMYQKLLEDIAVLHRLASRLSSRAEMVGAVRQEKRMSKATEVMMQYVENLKRTYEKDHAELMEYKKLANQNSSRSYGSPDDGVPRTSRSMSLSIGKMPRRRVSVAVVSKFELPGQSPSQSPVPLVSSSLSESSNGRSNLTSTPVLPVVIENGKPNSDPDCEHPPSASAVGGLEEISPEAKAKIEEEAYNKGYQEGLKKTKESEELKEDNEEKMDEKPKGFLAMETDDKISKPQSKLEVVIHYVQILYPKLHKHWNVLWIVAAIIIIFAIVLGTSSLYNYFFSYTEGSDGPQVKPACSAAHQYPWGNSGLQHDQCTE
ncbi:inositol 1,4,5-triphosphate receptor associated 1 isoform 3-T3 [Liasis olivaceus]